MTRVAFKMKLLPGFEEEYKKRHDEIWDELKVLLKQTGMRDYSIYLDPDSGELFGSMTIEDPLELDKLPEHPVMLRWWTYMKDIMETNPDHSPKSTPLKEVFYLP